MNQTTKAVIFDFDGTIIDTETAWYTAFRDAYKEHGVDLSLDMYSGCIGTSLHRFNPYEYLMTDLGLPIDKAEFRDAVHLRHARLMEREAIRPGVQSYLDEARRQGMRIGLASSSKREWVVKFLAQLGLLDYFEVIRTADDVEQVKPHPALYLQTMEALGVQPEETVAIEDSPNGAKAAHAAGIRCVVAPNAITRGLEFGPCTHLADSLEQIDFNRHVLI
ncbi:HAD family hydrolase [Paenibacillus pasadenensis]|uniref:Hydrolase, haloacid dehalogenase-like family n=1 Tax=Paenibacillus pasadenensis TaxID=217090 RepID=A0A2N5N0Q6_9BACL|nr:MULTISPECIES: HAD family hydrolase [Paenibacillus]PLT43905.1 hydrolase, haloacid dehalogenase-like family [Paenibacillus pasadenensis]